MIRLETRKKIFSLMIESFNLINKELAENPELTSAESEMFGFQLEDIHEAIEAAKADPGVVG